MYDFNPTVTKATLDSAMEELCNEPISSNPMYKLLLGYVSRLQRPNLEHSDLLKVIKLNTSGLRSTK